MNRYQSLISDFTGDAYIIDNEEKVLLRIYEKGAHLSREPFYDETTPQFRMAQADRNCKPLIVEFVFKYTDFNYFAKCSSLYESNYKEFYKHFKRILEELICQDL